MKKRIIIFSILVILFLGSILYFINNWRVILWDASKKEIKLTDTELDRSCGLSFKNLWDYPIGEFPSRKIYIKEKLDTTDINLLSNFALCYFEKDTVIQDVKIVDVFQKYDEDKISTPCIFFLSKGKNKLPEIYYTKNNTFIKIQ